MILKLFAVPGGWSPKFSPDGAHVCFGFHRGVGYARVGMDAVAHWVVANGLPCGWYSNTEILFKREAASGKPGLWLYHIETQTESPLSPISGQYVEATEGHWGVTQFTGGAAFWDGQELVTPGPSLGVSVRATQMVTSRTVSGQTVYDYYVKGTRVQSFTPPGARNKWVLGTGQWLGYGKFGPARVADLSTIPPTYRDVSCVPPPAPGTVCGEGPPRVFQMGATVWCLTGCEVGADMFMALRPLGDKAVIKIPAPGDAPDVHAFDDGSIYVAGEHPNTGLLQVWLTTEDATREAIVLPPPVVPPFPRKVWRGYYKAQGRDGNHILDALTSANCIVYGPRGDTAAGVDWRAEVKRTCEILRAHHGYLFTEGHPDVIEAVSPYWDIVAGVIVSPSGLNIHFEDADSVNTQAQLAREKMDKLGLRRCEVIAYFDGPLDAHFVVPDTDAIALQCYLGPSTPSQPVERLRALITAQLARVPATMPVYLTEQSYDRNGAWDDIPALVSMQTVPSEFVHKDPRVRGGWSFAFARKGGVLDHPELRPPQRAVFAANPGTPDIVYPEASVSRPKITITAYLPASGPAPLTVAARWKKEPGSGPIEKLYFRSRVKGTSAWTNETPQGHPLNDPDFNYRFATPGTYEIGLRATGPGGEGVTGKERLVTVTAAPEPPTPIPPPTTDTPEYDGFVNTESPAVASTFQQVTGNPPAPANMGHNSYRRLALGWTASQVLQGIRDASLNFDSAPWFGWVPVDYATFVNSESGEVAAAYRVMNPATGVPTPQQMGHTAWRRFAEFWTHRDILHSIKGEPLEDGGAGGAKPPVPPVVSRPGQVRGDRFAFVDDAGPFLATGQTLFHGFGSYARERENYEADLTTTKRLSHFNRMIVCGLRLGTNERSLDPADPQFKAHITGAINLAYDVYGQRTGVTIFGATYPAPTEAKQQAVVDMVGDAINAAGAHKVLYGEIANEGWGNGFAGDEGRDRLFRLATRLRAKCPALLIATTCPEVRPGVADDVNKAGVQYYYKGCKAATLVTEHHARSEKPPDGVWRHTKKPRREGLYRVPDCPDTRMNQEPWGPESSGEEGNDPLVLAMDAVATWTVGEGAYVLHCAAGIHGVFNPRNPGVDDDRPARIKDTVNYDAICTAIEACRGLLSPDLPNWTKFDSFDGPFEFVDIPNVDQFAACYSATSGRRIVQPVWGVVRTTTWRLKTGTCQGKVHDPLTGAVLATFDREFTVTPEQRAVLVIAERTS